VMDPESKDIHTFDPTRMTTDDQGRKKTTHHSSPLAGGNVAGAGMMTIKDKHIHEVTDESGHYRPEGEYTYQAVKEMASRGLLDRKADEYDVDEHEAGEGNLSAKVSLAGFVEDDPRQQKGWLQQEGGIFTGKLSLPYQAFLQTRGNERQARAKVSMLDELKSKVPEVGEDSGSKALRKGRGASSLNSGSSVGSYQDTNSSPLTSDVGREVLAGEGGAGGDEVGRGALEDDPAAVVAGAGAEVDDPVGVRHDRLVVLDDDDRLAGVDEPVEQAEQLLDVGEVQAGGRLVEDVDAALLGHVGGQLEPLPLAAGQRGERLAEAEVAEPDVGEPLEDLVRGRGARLAVAEERLGLGHRHREHLADVAAAEVVLEHRGLEPLPLALLAGGGDGGHDRQVGVDDAGAVAGGAGALGVGAEQRRLHAVGLRERLADRVEQPGVGRRVAAPRAADRGSGRSRPRRRGPAPSRGSASSCPTRPRR
jgi:hypothetical protein